ncbi:hypothetical protein C7M84_017026 [Penaeus vannamei]|uniref:Uncharacterized protein n=1 Tax=Penaeus vannamei TaxID=6689 RepID=A0A3R7LWH9_PENVA|nr:hypothetical protein C7M84_017026 [Penaeus vannamei]
MKDTRYVLSLSESEESDFDKGKTRILKMDPDMGTVIEGKRVTAVSNQDRSKRIRIDADTGKVKRDRNLLNTLRLFRHQKCGGEMSEEAKFEGAPSSPNRFAPRLSSLNLNPSVVLTERDKSIVDQQLQRSATTVVAGRSTGPMHTTPSSQPKGTWRYAGSLVAPANPTTTPRSSVPVSLPRSTSVQCYLRTKDGKVRVAPLQRALLSSTRQPNPGGNGNYLRMMNKPPSSGYEDSYAKFLLQQNPALRGKDKNNPTNLSRVLPKGTTVVRKPKSDGAGPSGLNNGGPSSAGPRAVVTRPGTFSTVVPRPSVTVMGSTSRAGNSVMAVRTNASAIRTTYSRGVVGTSTMGLQETTNSSPAPTVIASSPSGTVTTATGGPAVTTSSMPAPLVSATVVGSVPNSSTSSLSSPLGTLATVTQIICSTRGATTCTTTVASPPGDVPAASMLETLLRDRPVPPSPLHAPSTTATTTITSALPHTLTSVVGSSGVPMTLSVALQGLGTHPAAHIKPQLLALSQGTNTSTGSVEATVVQPQGVPVRAKIPPSTIVQKMLGRSSLVIRTLRPQTSTTQPSGESSSFEEGGGAAAATLSLPGGVQGISGQTSSNIPTSTAPQQQASLSSLPLTPTNAVSSETLEQLREFESVFEKVSNKSGKDASDGEASTENYSNATMSSEESMIAAQLLSMANDTPAVTTSSNYVYSVPTTVYGAGGTSLTEGTYITIPSTTQAGTLILVNHGGGGTGLVTVAGTGVQGQQPPTAPSPTLSSTSSHSSIASSPSSTSSKSKKQPPKQKVVPPATPPVVAKPKTPPPPKTSTPKQPTVAKTQVEENEEIRSRIHAILERYKQELVITPQQPAPRNRKNCPPPKSDGKSSSKKKSQVKKVEGTSVSSPAVSEGSVVGCPSPSPSPGPANDSSVGLPGNSSGVPTVQYTTQVVSGQGLTTQGPATTGSSIISEDKIKVESGQEVVAATTPQLLQGVVVSNVKVEGGATSLTQGLGGGRVVQLIRHRGKVTAITTRQPLNKVKGGSSPITQSPTVVNKIVQQQQAGGPQAVQQVVVQTSGGQQVLQQVAVQQLTSTPPKQKCSVVQQLGVTNSEELLGLTSARSIHVTLPTMPPSTIVSTPAATTASQITNSGSVTNTPPITIAHTITSNPVNSNTQTVAAVSTPSGTSGTGPSPLSVVPASPLTPQAITVTSPPTPQPVAASPHTPSPAAELPPTPSSFQMGEESNSSEHSGGDGKSSKGSKRRISLQEMPCTSPIPRHPPLHKHLHHQQLVQYL